MTTNQAHAANPSSMSLGRQMLNEVPESSKSHGRQMLNKVPEVTMYFWIIKVLCTTVGETAAASIVHTRSRICANLVPDVSVVWVPYEHGDDVDTFLGKTDGALHERKLESRRERMDAVA